MARALVARGLVALLVDDGDATRLGVAGARELGVDSVAGSRQHDGSSSCSTASTRCCPAPGLPERHPLFAAAAASRVGRSSASSTWPPLGRPSRASPSPAPTARPRSPRSSPRCSRRPGCAAVAAGNTETPLVEAIDDPAVDVFVVEASSFRLGPQPPLPPRRSATWLNFAPDHLDVHATSPATSAAKARIWADQATGRRRRRQRRRPGRRCAHPTRAAVATVHASVWPTGRRPADDYLEATACWSGPAATELVARRRAVAGPAPRRRSTRSPRPATALAAGATLDGVRTALADVRGPRPSGAAGRRARRRALVRRLQGHHAARHRWPRSPASPRSCSSPAAATRASTSRRWPTPAAASRAVVGIGEAGRRGGRAPSPRPPGRTSPTSMADAVAAAPARRAAATPSCCRRGAPRSTGTRPTPSGATTSPEWCAPRCSADQRQGSTDGDLDTTSSAATLHREPRLVHREPFDHDTLDLDALDLEPEHLEPEHLEPEHGEPELGGPEPVDVDRPSPRDRGGSQRSERRGHAARLVAVLCLLGLVMVSRRRRWPRSRAVGRPGRSSCASSCSCRQGCCWRSAPARIPLRV